MRMRAILLPSLILAASAAILPLGPSYAASISDLSVTYQRPVPAQVPLAAVGVPKAILDPSGVKLSVVVNAFHSPVKSIEGSPPGGGRWTSLDVSVTNVGVLPFTVSAGDFLLISPDSTVFRADGDSNLPTPQLADTTLMPGDTLSGNVVYAIPGGAQLQMVAFQAVGMSQWVVALLGS